MTGHLFRAIWPIRDQTASWDQILREAADDLPLLIAQAHATVTGHGRFSVAPSAAVPGSGRITPCVLVYEAPARPRPARPYHARSARR